MEHILNDRLLCRLLLPVYTWRRNDRRKGEERWFNKVSGMFVISQSTISARIITPQYLIIKAIELGISRLFPLWFPKIRETAR